MKFQIPQPMTEEHEELHNNLRKAVMAGGKVGEAAKAVAQALPTLTFRGRRKSRCRRLACYLTWHRERSLPIWPRSSK